MSGLVDGLQKQLKAAKQEILAKESEISEREISAVSALQTQLKILAEERHKYHEEAQHFMVLAEATADAAVSSLEAAKQDFSAREIEISAAKQELAAKTIEISTARQEMSAKETVYLHYHTHLAAVTQELGALNRSQEASKALSEALRGRNMDLDACLERCRLEVHMCTYTHTHMY
jgi:uncharacterized protein (DUF3084 family)